MVAVAVVGAIQDEGISVCATVYKMDAFAAFGELGGGLAGDRG